MTPLLILHHRYPNAACKSTTDSFSTNQWVLNATWMDVIVPWAEKDIWRYWAEKDKKVSPYSPTLMYSGPCPPAENEKEEEQEENVMVT